MVIAIFSGRVLYRGSRLRIRQPRNRGTFADFLPVSFPELGQCVHIQLPAVNGKQFRQKNLRRESHEFGVTNGTGEFRLPVR
jgi:hypothetical protein